MSHFTVLVVGENPEDQLAPYEEFECSGENTKYIVEVDETDSLRKTYEEEIKEYLKDSEGNLHEKWENKFYRDPTEEEKKHIGFGGSGFIAGSTPFSFASKDWDDGKGYRAKVQYVPEGYTLVKVPLKEVMSFFTYAVKESGHKIVPAGCYPDIHEDHKFGYVQLTNDNQVKVFRRTNPNGKWDWYSLGGRWQGYFRLKPRSSGKLGRPGVFGSSLTAEDKELYCDQAYKKDIDFEAMYREAEIKATEDYAKLSLAFDVLTVTNNGIPKIEHRWDDVLKMDHLGDINAKRLFYHNQESLVLFNEVRDKLFIKTRDEHYKFLLSVDLEDYQCSLEEYVLKARNRAISTFAVVKDGKWYEKGKMGFWCMIDDEKDQESWNTEVKDIIDPLPGDTLLSIYDCHI